MSTIEEQIAEGIDALTEAARINGVDSKVVDFLLDHLVEWSDDLAEKYADHLECETELRNQEED